MVKKICWSFLVIILLLIKTSSLYAQDIPGFTCGVSGADDGTDRCCVIDYPPEATQSPDLKKNLDNINTNPDSMCPSGGDPTVANAITPGCRCVSNLQTENKPLKSICSKLNFKNLSEKKSCEDCSEGGGAWTALGCVPGSFQGFVTVFLLNYLVGLAGVIAMLCIIYSAFVLQTSRGNPEKIKKAREYLTNCVLGLILIIFSVFILRLIGVVVLRIPGFS